MFKILFSIILMCKIFFESSKALGGFTLLLQLYVIFTT